MNSVSNWPDLKRVALAFAVSVSIAGIASAESPIGSIAEFKGAHGIQWQTDAPHGGAVMVITGPRGFVWEQVYQADQSLGFDFETIAGSFLADGNYSYELVVSPALSKAEKADLGMMRSISDEYGAAAIEDFVAAGFPSQSGAFLVTNGRVVSSDLVEVAAKNTIDGDLETRDQQILDDLIVAGSACVGVDCNNGESFGFDTLRLKENNLRIKFDDTSTSASFPSNDWQLTANESDNGGLNKFSIDDVTGGRTPFTIEAGAPSNSLYVDDGGRLGIGTSTPVVNAHVVEGNTPTLRLEQNGSSGFTPQTWDVAGNEAGFFVRDVTNGSSLSLRIRPGAPESSIDIAGDGDVGMGTGSPSASLHVADNKTDFQPHLRLQNTNSTNTFVGMRLSAAGTDIDFNNTAGEWRLNFDDGDSQELSLDADGNLTVEGTLTANGSAFPDYVFASGYTLMPLSEVAAFIDTNQHLPNVPSAAEIARDGLNMTQMQKILMEKVEELTLYTIEQQRLIDELRAQLEHSTQ